MNKIRNFMNGRYGSDELSRLLLVLAILLGIINLFKNSIIMNIIESLLLVIIIYRTLSKNLYKRVKENNIYLDIKHKIISIVRNDNNFIYRKCHKCKTKLRLPKPSKMGIKHVKCPTCGKRNTYLIINKK